MVTFFTITTENQNTAINSVAERKGDAPSMVDKQSSFPELSEHSLFYFYSTTCLRFY